MDDNDEDGQALEATDIVIRKFNINMGMKDQNPLEKVTFYREENGFYKSIKK